MKQNWAGGILALVAAVWLVLLLVFHDITAVQSARLKERRGSVAPRAKNQQPTKPAVRTTLAPPTPPPPPHYNYVAWQRVDYECVDDWDAAAPLFPRPSDALLWLAEDRLPHGGCTWVNATHCRFRGGCSHYQVAYDSRVPWDSLGNCGSHEVLEVARGANCDPRTFVPLRVPEGAYFPKFLENVMTRLVRAILMESNVSAIVVYVPSVRLSPDTTSVARRLGFTLTHQFPTQCFRKVVWVCHTVSIDPLAYEHIQRMVQRPYAEYEALDKAIAGGAAPCRGGVYASRLKGAQGNRPVANERQVVDHLRSMNFTVFEGGEPLDQWVSAVSGACVFVGPHGGALAHMWWLRRHIRGHHPPVVIELDGHTKDHNWGNYWLAARNLGLQYMWMFFDSERGVNTTSLDLAIEQAKAL